MGGGGLWGIISKAGGGFSNSQNLGRTGQNIAAVSFRQLPWASVDIRGLRGRKMTDGRFWNYYGGDINPPKWQKIGRNGRNITAVSFCGRQWAPVAFLGGIWKKEDGELLWKRGRGPPQWKTLGRGGRNIDSGIPPPSPACAHGLRGRKMEAVGLLERRGGEPP